MLKRSEAPDHSSEDWRARLSTEFNAVIESELFKKLADGTLPVRNLQCGLLYFYPLIANFPQYLGTLVGRLPRNTSPVIEHVQSWIIQNLEIESHHAEWFRDWGIGFLVPKEMYATSIRPPAEMDAINHYLYAVTNNRPIIEGLAALCLGVEGATGIWAKRAKIGVRKCAKRAGIQVHRPAYRWVDMHASYDDRHPDEAYQLIKALITTDDEMDLAIDAARRALEYYAMAATACMKQLALPSAN